MYAPPGVHAVVELRLKARPPAPRSIITHDGPPLALCRACPDISSASELKSEQCSEDAVRRRAFDLFEFIYMEIFLATLTCIPRPTFGFQLCNSLVVCAVRTC